MKQQTKDPRGSRFHMVKIMRDDVRSRMDHATASLYTNSDIERALRYAHDGREPVNELQRIALQVYNHHSTAAQRS